MTREVLKRSLDQIELSLSQLEKEGTSLNGLSPDIYCKNKLVYEIDGRIYRIASPMELKQRILLQKFFQEKGYTVFEPDIFEEKLSTKHFMVTSQRKMDEINPKNQKELFNSLPDELKLLMKELQVIWYDVGNCGIIDGEIKILDWVANVAVSPNQEKGTRLVNRRGDLLAEIDY